MEGLLLRQLELFFAKHSQKFESVLELTFALNLEQHGNCCVLLLSRHICEVVLAISQLFGAQTNVNVQRTSLCIELGKRCSTNVEGLKVPADTALNALVREQEILNSIVVILNATLRLCKARQVAAAITGYQLNLTAALLLKHFGITLCFSNSIDVIERHRTESSKGLFFVIFGLFCICSRSNSLFNNFFNNLFNNGLLNNLFSNGLFVFDQSDCIGCICGFVEVFSHSLCNSLLYLFGYVNTVVCVNLVCKFVCNLVSLFTESIFCGFKLDAGNLSVEVIHSLCNSIGSIHVSSFCFFGSNFFCKSFCQSVNAFLNDCIGIVDNVGNNNRFNLGNVAFGFNSDNRISAALFKLDELHADKDRNNNEQNESDENDKCNTDCGAPERNLEIGSKHKGNLACGNVALNNIVGTVLAQAYGVGVFCERLVGAVVDVEIISRHRQTILLCNDISSYGNENAECVAFLCAGDVDGVALVGLQTANCLTGELGGNIQGCSNGIGNTVFTKDNDCTVGSGNNDVVANNGHCCFKGCYVEIIVNKCGDGCLYGVGTGLGNESFAAVVGVLDSSENLCGELFAVCAFNNQLICACTCGGKITVIKEFTTVQNNVVGLLRNSDILNSTNAGLDGVKCIGNVCCQCVVACVNDGCKIFNNHFNGLVVTVVTDCLDVQPCVVTTGEGRDAFPSDGGDLDGGYGNLNLEGLYGVVILLSTFKLYAGVAIYLTDVACYNRNRESGCILNGNSIVTDNAVQCGNGGNANAVVNVVGRVVGGGSNAVCSPSQLCGLDFCRNGNCFTTVGKGDARVACVCRVKYSSSRYAVNRNCTCYSGVAVVDLYPVAVLQFYVGVVAKGNRCCVCVDREDHAANHNREHCYKSHNADEIALACKLNLLMFHNITTFP